MNSAYAQALVGRSPANKPRAAEDFYPTPPSAIAALIAAEAARWRAIGGPIWEPAAGRGDLVVPLRQAGFEVIASDMVNRGMPGCERRDFHSFGEAAAPILVTNPPFAACNRIGDHWWVRHAHALGVAYMALLLPSDWDAVAARLALFDLWRPARRLTMTWRLDFTGGGNSTAKCCWWVWERGWTADHTQSRLLPRPDGANDVDFEPALEDRR